MTGRTGAEEPCEQDWPSQAAFLMRTRCANVHQGSNPKNGFMTRPKICVQSDLMAMTCDLASEGQSI